MEMYQAFDYLKEKLLLPKNFELEWDINTSNLLIHNGHIGFNVTEQFIIENPGTLLADVQAVVWRLYTADDRGQHVQFYPVEQLHSPPTETRFDDKASAH